MTDFILAIIVSFLISAIFTPLVRNYFIRKNWIELPNIKDRKTKNATSISPVPRGGGIAIFISLLITTLIFIPVDKHLIGIIFASFFVLIIGILDDVLDISPIFRLFTNIIAACIVVASGIGIAYISNPFGGIIDFSMFQINFANFSIWVVSDLLAIVWIVWCMNIVGWSTGVDGQLPGFVSISALFIGILGFTYSADFTQWPVIILSTIVAGSYLGFLPYNFFPQSIMPGYSGKSLAGFLLAVLSILSGAKLATLIFLLSVPMLDAIYSIFRRFINKKPIYLGDGKHFHHQLLKVGFSRRQISLIYWLISFILGIISLTLNSQQKFYTFIAVGLILLAIFNLLSRHTLSKSTHTDC